MASDRSILERQMERVELRPFTLEGFHRRRQRKQRNRQIGAAVVALVVAAAGIGGFVRAISSGTVPAADPRSPFLGTWFSTDGDGSAQTMTIRASGEGAVEIVVHDDFASVCSGAPSTMTGTGRLEGTGELVIPSPVLACDEGSEPEALSGPPLQEQLRNLTFVYQPETETLTDTFGSVWGPDPSPEPTSEGMWPQSTLDEVRKAQELADGGDPAYTWQVQPELETHLDDAEIFARFLREELGWEEFIWNPSAGYEAGDPANNNESLNGLEYIRCAPGRTNPIYPDDPRGGACAPTIDEFRYETVQIDVAQLDRQGPSGIWVVTSWRPGPPFQQMTPPSDAEVTELLNAFLDARVAGEGAQAYVNVPEGGVPLLYATTSGAPYERAEFETLSGPRWHDGSMEFQVRLFGDGGETVVEQRFVLDSAAAERLDYLGDPIDGVPATRENGRPVADRYGIVDGEITFAATNPPWRWVDWIGSSRTMSTLLYDGEFEGFRVMADPLPVGTGCEVGPAATDAAALAATIQSDPDVEATEPVPVRIAGIEGLQMDVAAAPGASICGQTGEPALFMDQTSELGSMGSQASLWHRHSYRLYLLDVPEGSSRVLAIQIFAFDRDFERVVEAAAPVLDSLEFRSG